MFSQAGKTAVFTTYSNDMIRNLRGLLHNHKGPRSFTVSNTQHLYLNPKMLHHAASGLSQFNQSINQSKHFYTAP